ncbi:MAG: 2Fe-2S iron-sulfur cluster-binding protein [Thermoanaerobaculaceae bacterium]
MPKLTIDGRVIEVAEGTNLIEAARRAGVAIPYFCYHPYLSVVGQCRICLVEIEKQPRLAVACATPATDGMVVRSETSDRVREARNAVMEFLLANHPLDCPVCDQAGECLLQDHSFEQGLDTTHMVETRRTFPGLERRRLGPHIVQNQNRCIHCSRCIRFTQEVSETAQLTYKSRGNRAFIDTHDGTPFDDPMSGCAADVCPVGALTVKEFRFRKRTWKLRSAPSVCPGCSIGCNVWIDHHERVVYRLTPRENAAINATWMCDFGRFLAESLNHHEVLRPQRQVDGHLQPVDWAEALAGLRDVLDTSSSLRVVASANLSNEELFLAKALLGGARRADIVVPVWSGEKRRMKNGSGAWQQSHDAHPNAAGARRLGLRLVDQKGLARFLYGSADVTVILDPLAHPFMETDEATQLLRVSTTVVFARLEHPVTRLASWLLPTPSLACNEGTFTSSTGAVQRFAAALAPPAHARPLWLTLTALARELEVEELALGSPADVFAHLVRAEKGFAGLAWDALAGTTDTAQRERHHGG